MPGISLIFAAATAAGMCSIAPGAPAATAPAVAVPVKFPHPLITEVLYNVPMGGDGDANKDGVRSANGDEFIEIVNPHDKAIELEGYTITDGVETQIDQTKKGSDSKEPKKKKSGTVQKPQIEFVFPKLTLQPGEKVVLFNGYKQKFAGPHGTAQKAPEKPDAEFGGAYVFTINAESNFIALNNASDAVQLLAPSKGKDVPRETIEVVWWGKPGEATYDHGATLIEEVKEGKGSVHRVGRSKVWTSSIELSGSLKGLFSPGEVDLDAVPEPAKDTKHSKKDAAAPDDAKVPKGNPLPAPAPDEKTPK